VPGKKKHFPTKMPRCLFDGHDFEGDGYSYPNAKKQNGKFEFDECTMCSPSCGKGYIDTYLQASPHLLTWLHLHVHRDLGIQDMVPTAPSPRNLACNRRDGKGMTIKQFRQFGFSHRLTEKINHLPIDLRVWVQQPQVDCDLPFHTVVRAERLVADMLFQDFKAKGLPIPITLLKEAAANEEKLKLQEAEALQQLTLVVNAQQQQQTQTQVKAEEEEEPRVLEIVETEEEAKTVDPVPPPPPKRNLRKSVLSPMHPIHKKRKV
jgi:hypothetical protein